LTLVLLAVLASLPMTPFGPADLAAWHRMLNSQCPRHHIDSWMPERSQVDLIDKFETPLPSKIQAEIAKAADARRTCANAEGDEANSCEKIVDIHALRKLHLLVRFTAYACSQAICSEPASCDRPPAH
jgi:hypothetical protein